MSRSREMLVVGSALLAANTACLIFNVYRGTALWSLVSALGVVLSFFILAVARDMRP